MILLAAIFGFLSVLIFCFLLILIALITTVFDFLSAFLFILDYCKKFINILKSLLNYLVDFILSRIFFEYKIS